MDKIKFRNAIESDLQKLTDIYNQAIISGGCTAHLTPRNLEDRKIWFEEYTADKYPIIVAEIDKKLIAYGTLSPYRKGREALSSTSEVSFYIDKHYHQKGIGSLLLSELLMTAKKLNYKNILAILYSSNIPSIKLLEKYNFELWAKLPELLEVNNSKYDHLYYGLKIKD